MSIHHAPCFFLADFGRIRIFNSIEFINDEDEVLNSKSNIKLALVVALFLSICVYHIFDYYYANFTKNSPGAIFHIYKSVQLGVTASFFVVIAYTKALARILLRESYIGGSYKGYSNDYNYSRETKTCNLNSRKMIEIFVITQNIFDTRITGFSWDKDEDTYKLISTWEGNLVKHEGHTFVFAVDLTTSSGEYGIIKATFNNSEVHGFYFSGEPNTKSAACFTANKVSKSEIMRAGRC